MTTSGTPVSDPYNADTDGDGLTDGLELTMGVTDPLNADSNNNGCPDGEEALGGCGDACVGDLNLNESWTWATCSCYWATSG